MDKVYKRYEIYASADVNLKEYFAQYTESLKFVNEEASVFDIMGVNLNDDEAKFLTEYCSIDNLTVPGEMPKIAGEHDIRRKRKKVFANETIPDDLDLKTLKEVKKKNERENVPFPLKYKSELFVNYDEVFDPKTKVVPGEDILVDIRVYEPFMSHKSMSIYKSPQPQITVKCVIAILGFQTLHDLRDKILCSSDLCISTESSNNPNTISTTMAKDVYKSGFFFIDGKFYNDFRDPENTDTSEVIIKWAKAHDLGTFETCSMENVRIDSINTKFGYPWVYQHQGDCEHLIVFSDARLINRTDELAVSAYPRIVRMKTNSTKYCLMCCLYPVTWVTTENDRTPHDPCFFCDTCFKSFNYINGEKIGNFKAYQYPHYTNLAEEANIYVKRSNSCEELQNIA